MVHVTMETTKVSNFTFQSKSFISIFFTRLVSACELQPLSCHDLANDIYSQTAKTVFSRLKGSVSSVTRPCLLKIRASRQTNMSLKQRCKQQK